MLRVILKFYLILAVFMVAGSGMFSTVAADSGVSQNQIVVKLQTTLGDIDIALESDKAPETVKNFLAYVDEGFYNGTIFHRIVPGFVIQGGGLEANRREKPTRSPIRNEAANGLKNDRYSVAMARTPEPHSATAQFYINLADNDNLNYTEPTWEGFGYAVFGKVILGQEVVDKIALAPETVSIIKALRVNSGASQ